MLLCDSKRHNAAYHVDCLKLWLSKILEGNRHSPTCAPCKQLVDNEQGVRQILRHVDTSLEGRKYWKFKADKESFFLKLSLFDESLRTELIRQKFEESSTELAKKYLDIDYFGRLYWGFPCSSDSCGIVINRNSMGILLLFYLVVDGCTTTILVLKFLFDEALNTKLFRQTLNKSSTELDKRVLGIDSLGRFYWGFPSSSPNCGIVINGNLPSQHEDSGIWYLLRSEEEISSLVDYLNTNDPEAVHLRESISHRDSSVLHEGRQTIHNSVERHMVYSTDLNKSSKKPGGVACLDQVASKAWLSNLVGKACPILKQLKIRLLNMEAALTDGARRPSRASLKWRSAWCAFVKSANTIYEMVEAILVLETMIKNEHINNTWFWSSALVAANTSTMSALALRIYTLDSAINHPDTPLGSCKNQYGQKETNITKS